MNKLTQIIGNDANVADGTFSPKLNAGAVRKPYPPECIECLGEGTTFCTSNNPYEKGKYIECRRCDGWGLEPETEEEE